MKVIRNLYHSLIIERQKPINLKVADDFLFMHEFKKILHDSNVYELNHVYLTWDGYLYDRYFRLIKKSVRFFNEFANYRYRYFIKNVLLKKWEKKSRIKKYIVFYTQNDYGYFHFVTDFLTKLIEVRSELDEYILLIPENFNLEFHKKYLSFFAINRIENLKKDKVYNFESLLFVDNIAPSGNYLPENINKLRNYIVSCVKNDINFNIGELLYLSRAKAKWRFILNEKEVIDEVVKKGFKVVYFEDYTLVEQISIMRNAKCVIGIIGANLTNIIYMPENTSIFEFRKKNDKYNNCYYSLASALNINFYYQQCESVETRKGDYFNLTVDIKELKENLNLLLDNFHASYF